MSNVHPIFAPLLAAIAPHVPAAEPALRDERCHRCHGDGHLEHSINPEGQSRTVRCYSCGGRGYIKAP